MNKIFSARNLILGVGGLGAGYFWYQQNASQRAYDELNDEEFHRLYLKMENEFFPENYLMGRTFYTKMFHKHTEVHQGMVPFNVSDQTTQQPFVQNQESYLEEKSIH